MEVYTIKDILYPGVFQEQQWLSVYALILFKSVISSTLKGCSTLPTYGFLTEVSPCDFWFGDKSACTIVELSDWDGFFSGCPHLPHRGKGAYRANKEETCVDLDSSTAEMEKFLRYIACDSTPSPLSDMVKNSLMAISDNMVMTTELDKSYMDRLTQSHNSVASMAAKAVGVQMLYAHQHLASFLIGVLKDGVNSKGFQVSYMSNLGFLVVSVNGQPLNCEDAKRWVKIYHLGSSDPLCNFTKSKPHVTSGNCALVSTG